MDDLTQVCDVVEWAVTTEPMRPGPLRDTVHRRADTTDGQVDAAVEECLGAGRVVDVDGVLHPAHTV